LKQYKTTPLSSSKYGNLLLSFTHNKKTEKEKENLSLGNKIPTKVPIKKKKLILPTIKNDGVLWDVYV